VTELTRRRVALGDLAMVILAGVFVIAAGLRPPRDVDLYWHRVVGRTLLNGWWQTGGVDPISYSSGQPWVPGAWTIEVAYSWLIDAWGYGSILTLRLVLATGFAVALAYALRRGRPAWAAAVTFAATALPMTGYLQDRPQSVSFILLVPVALLLRAGLHGGVGPPWWVYPLAGWAWANIHGYWVMIPVVCVLLALAQVLDHGHDGVRPALQWFGKAILATVGAALTPFGLAIVLTPLRLSAATDVIAEWQPSNVNLLESWAPALLLGLLAVSWARAGRTVPRGTVFVVVVLAAFAALAIRNLPVAAILLAPLAADALASWPRRSHRTLTVPRWAPVVTGVVAVCVAALVYSGIPVVPTGFPSAIAAGLAKSQQPVRLLTDYNLSGFLRDAGGEQVRVAIDGRADRYGSSTITAFTDMVSGKPGWQETFERYDPDLVVLHEDDVLIELLETRLGWTVTQTDRDFVMLAPPAPSAR